MLTARRTLDTWKFGEERTYSGASNQETARVRAAHDKQHVYFLPSYSKQFSWHHSRQLSEKREALLQDAGALRRVPPHVHLRGATNHLAARRPRRLRCRLRQLHGGAARCCTLSLPLISCRKCARMAGNAPVVLLHVRRRSGHIASAGSGASTRGRIWQTCCSSTIQSAPAGPGLTSMANLVSSDTCCAAIGSYILYAVPSPDAGH